MSQDIMKHEELAYEQLERFGKQMLFYNKMLLPVLSLQVCVEEVARDQFDSADGVLLNLIHTGIDTAEALAHFSGLALRNIHSKLSELFALGFLQHRQDNKVTLTELGQRSLNRGRAIRHVSRGLLDCAVTEQLLPRESYNKRLVTTEQLTADDLKFTLVAGEQQRVSLAQLSGINSLDYASKKRLNLPDEVEQLVAIEDYTAGFIPIQLLVAGNQQMHKAWMQFGSCFLDLPLNRVPQLSSMRNKRNAIQGVIDALKQDGVIADSNVDDSNSGVIRLTARQVSKRWLGATSASYLPNIIRCESEYVKPRPFYRYPVSAKDRLNGNALIIDLSQLDEKIQRQALALSKFYKKKAYFFNLPRKERPERTLPAYLATIENYKRQELLTIASELGIKPIRKWLQQANSANDGD